MRLLYKALASAGMIALSTAAALGIRHLVKKPAKDGDLQPVPEKNPADHRDEDAETAADVKSEPQDESAPINEPQNEPSAQTQESVSSDDADNVEKNA